MSSRLPAAQRRRQLLDVALGEFARDGFRGTTMDRIADAAGVTKPVLYQHFPSKRDLFLELLADFGSRLSDTIVNAAATAGSPHAQVARGFSAYFAFVDQHRDAFYVLFGGGTKLDPEFASIVQGFEDDMAETIAELIVIDGLPDAHRQLLAHGIVGIAEVTSRNWLRSADQIGHLQSEVLAEQIATLAWAGLRGVQPA